eukprot:s2726_g4.t1
MKLAALPIPPLSDSCLVLSADEERQSPSHLSQGGPWPAPIFWSRFTGKIDSRPFMAAVSVASMASGFYENVGPPVLSSGLAGKK